MNNTELQELQDNVSGSFELAGYRVAVIEFQPEGENILITLLLDEEVKVKLVAYENKLFLNDDLHNIQLLGEIGSDTVVNSINEFIKQ